MSTSVFFDIAAALAITALLAESYGFVRRKMGGTNYAPLILGVLFGLMALTQMFTPVEPYEGVFIDMRCVPITLAGAFLGWRGLIPCLAIGVATRYGLGGVGTAAGITGMFVAGFVGILWARKTAHMKRRGLGMLMVLAGAMSTHVATAILVPYDAAVWFFSVAATPMVIVNLVAVPFIGMLLERENRRIQEENRMSAAVTRDPDTGLLTGPAFVRDLTNTYATRPFGTFAGFLTISTDTGMRLSMTGLLGDNNRTPVDAQTLAMNMDHANLAGMCADGSTLVPLTAWEVENISRIKSGIRAAMRNNRRDGETAGLIDMKVIEAPEPAEFIRIAEGAVVAVRPNWNVLPGPLRTLTKRPLDEQPLLRHSRIFAPEEHDVLFAKANFLIDRSQG